MKTFCLNPTVKIDVIHGCIPTYGGSNNAVMPTYKFEKKTFYSSVINLEYYRWLYTVCVFFFF